MTEKEKIKAKTEELLNRASTIGHSEYLNGGIHTCITLLDFIDSLPEEPVSEDLEEAINELLKEFYGTIPSKDTKIPISDGIAMFSLGSKWKKEQLLKDAIDGKVCWYDGDVYLDTDDSMFLYFFNHNGLEVGDKVKLIIIKED